MKKSKAIKEALEGLRHCRCYPVGWSLSPDVMLKYDEQIRDDRRRVLEVLWDRAIEFAKEKKT